MVTLAVLVCLIPLPASAMQSGNEALGLLKAGNQRFVDNTSAQPRTRTEIENMKSVASQDGYAFATILSCSDSRAPVERLFDTSIMDIFTIQVAGNVMSDDVAATIEYGLAVVKTPLLVILGHTHCGAVAAAVKAVEKDKEHYGKDLSKNVAHLIDKIEPAVREVRAREPNLTQEALVESSVDQNVWQVLENLFTESQVVRDKYKNKKVLIVCAVYDIRTGKVHWFDQQRVQEIYDAVSIQKKQATIVATACDKFTNGKGAFGRMKPKAPLLCSMCLSWETKKYICYDPQAVQLPQDFLSA